MTPLNEPLLFLLSWVTCKELARQVAWQKEESRVYRERLPERIASKEEERRGLLTAGREPGPELKPLMTTVGYDLFGR